MGNTRKKKPVEPIRPRKKAAKKKATKKVPRKKKPVASKPAKKKTPAKPAKKAGRPAGSKTSGQSSEGYPPKCGKCQSTKRTPYSNTRRVECAGNDPMFGPYTAVMFRNTTCENCGQSRVDRELVNEV